MYYVLDEQPPGDGTLLAAVGEYPDDAGVKWLQGRPLATPVVEPLRFELDPDSPGPLAYYLSGTVPLMHNDLLEVLKKSGVDNLDVYDAIITDPESGDEYDEYKAVNVIGVVAAADLANSTYESHLSEPLISVDFDSLAIDEKSARGMLLFRLAECITAIVVHEKVKQALEAADIYVGFIEPKNFVG